MENSRVLLIVNPISGTRNKDSVPQSLAKALSEKNVNLDVKFTTGANDALQFATEAADAGYNAVVAAGGDGTVREIATALTGRDTALGIIPCGSGNGLARTLEIPQDIEKAIEIIAEGETMLCDHGEANGKPFFCTFGMGFDAAVTEKYSEQKRRGLITYIRSALMEYRDFSSTSYALEINGMVITRRAFLIAVCNTSQYGNNAYIAPRASICDGLLDVVVAHEGNPIQNAVGIMDLMTGNLDKNTLVETFKVPEVTLVRINEGPVQFDGEPDTLGKRIDVKCCAATNKVIVPGKMHEFKPVLSPLRSMIMDIHYDFLNFIRNK